MADPTLRDILAELTTLRAEVATLKRKRRRTRLLPLALVALLVALLPLSLLAASPFTDLTGGVHDPNIEAIYTAGVTKGCVPNEQYCPTANVTREEMASFLARLGGLGSNPPVANAFTATNATNAGNAAQLNGQPASFYQAANQPIANAGNANTVGGYVPGGLVRVVEGQSQGETILGGVAATWQAAVTVTLTAPGPGFVLLVGALTVFSTAPTCGCVISVRLHELTTERFSLPMSATTGPTAGASLQQNLSATAVFLVPGAGAWTFLLEAVNNQSPPATVTLAELTALYVPFDGTGVPPSP